MNRLNRWMATVNYLDVTLDFGFLDLIPDQLGQPLANISGTA
ncbi:hypothetical protein [Nitrosomonas sp.]|nr:hypothetical protein [Nitrosomonas sp.]